MTMKATAAKPIQGGAVSIGPLSASLPTDATSSATGFSQLGYISEDGVTRTREIDNDVVKAWGGDVVLVLEMGQTEKFKFTLIEPANVNVLKLVNGDDAVTGSDISTGIAVTSNARAKGGHKFIIDMLEAEDTWHRICVPNGVLSSLGDTTYVDNGAVGYEVEITAIADSSGNTAYEYIKTGSTGS